MTTATDSGGTYFDFFAPPSSSETVKDGSTPLSPVTKEKTPEQQGRLVLPPSKILPFLFIGRVEDAQDADFIRRENVRTIVNLSQELYWTEPSIRVEAYSVSDSADADIAQFFRPISDSIERTRLLWAKQQGRVVSGRNSPPASAAGDGASGAPPPSILVHCQQGRSRSVSCVAAYLIFRNGWTAEESLQFIQARRAIADPNMGFLSSLQKLEKRYQGRHLERLRRLRFALKGLDATIADDKRLADALLPFGDVWRVRRNPELGVTVVFFTCEESVVWATGALNTPPHFGARVLLTGDPAGPHITLKKMSGAVEKRVDGARDAVEDDGDFATV